MRMQARADSWHMKHFIVCLLFFSLFFTSYMNISVNGTIGTDDRVIDLFSVSARDKHALIADNSAVISMLSFKIWRLPDTRTAFKILTAVLAALIIGLLSYTRLSINIGPKLGTDRIIRYLHKKDGMK